MSRPTNEELKSKILEVARKEFMGKGYERASLQNISRIVGISNMPVYSYFKNKENLFNTIVGEATESLLDAISNPEEVAMLVEKRLSENGSLTKVLSELPPEVLISL